MNLPFPNCLPSAPWRLATVIWALLAALALPATAQTPTPTPLAAAHAAAETPWQASLDAFAAADAAQLPPPGGVLFVGSSSIRLWNDLEEQFDAPVIVKRGFGGSRMSDCTRYLQRLVLPYKPRLVIVYAGDNDLAEGRSPQDILRSFNEFVDGVRAELPETRITFLSIKPSPLRAPLLGKIRETNRLVADFVAARPGLGYIDVFSRMIDENGMPRSELFRDDALHLNEAGYAVWREVIAGYLR
ncbi:SGNH/GDSL hydrolase family protein [Propionivibrio soli]|uniref:SGNH/GDSL hydrolase family protein n=1 Tax=Propionivibrio soli TaxID=2976531 RepID=UPI0021E8411B|nr:SGNH/GDSL hydrolase family protein [Propionivibrio soli]